MPKLNSSRDDVLKCAEPFSRTEAKKAAEMSCPESLGRYTGEYLVLKSTK
jgi:hypothetical protein